MLWLAVNICRQLIIVNVPGKNPTVQNAMLYGEGGSNQDGNGFGDQHEPALTQMGMLSIRKNLDSLDVTNNCQC